MNQSSIRKAILLILVSIVLAVKFATDPTGGAVTMEFLIYISTPILVILLTHWLRKVLFPYVDMGDLYDTAKTSAVGAGLTFVGMAIVMFSLMALFGPAARAQDVKTFIPAQAKIHAPVLVAEQKRMWPDHPKHTSLVV